MSATEPAPTSPPPDGRPDESHKRRRWWIAALVVVGIGAAFALGMVIGDDDVATTPVQTVQQSTDSSQAQTDQALDAISDGFQNLANAISRQDSQDDQAAKQAIDDATKEIEDALQQMGADASANVSGALDDLRSQIEGAVQTHTTETTPSTTETTPSDGG